MSNYQDPNQAQQPVVRHRRSERHRQTGLFDAPAPAPVQQEPPVQQPPEPLDLSQENTDEIKWQRRTPSSWPEETAEPDYSMPKARRRSSRASAQEDPIYMRRPAPPEGPLDYDDEEAPRSVPVGRIILFALIGLLLFFVALHFIQDAGPLNPIKNAVDGLISVKSREPGEALSFQTASGTAAVNTRLQLALTTNQTVDSVRIEDINGSEIPCTVTLVNGANETNKIWNISAIFDEPYTGNIYAVIRQDNAWTRTDKYVSLSVVAPTPLPTETPLPTQVPVTTPAPVALPDLAVYQPAPTEEPYIFVEPEMTEEPVIVLSAAVTWAPTNPPLPTEAPTPLPTEAPTPEPVAPPTAEPTAAPTAGPTALPTSTPLPRLEAESAVSSLKTTESVYQGKKSVSFTRTNGLIAPNPDEYTHYPMGVATFRGDNFRRNAAYGTAAIQSEGLSVAWSTPLGSLRTEDNGTLYGVGWTGQPAIIRWTREVRQGMNLYEDKKADKYLTEVIFGAQDGKIYFLDLADGSPTRDTINVGYPLKGSVSIDSMDRPLLAVGQGISKLANGKTGTIGMRLFNLVTGKEAYLLNGRKSDNQVQYSTNGAFDGTALFLFDRTRKGVDALVAAGENGLLYTVDLNGNFVYPNADNPEAPLSIEIKPSVTYLRTKSGDEKDAQVSVECSVAMYDKYIYMADAYGVIRCVDSDTMKTVWAVDGGDNIDALALDLDDSGGVSLYAGNTAYSRLGSKNPVTIRRLNALTGQEIWRYQIKCDYDKNQQSGCKASPVIGQNSIGNLVIFTVNKVDGGGSRVIALNKQTGAVVWENSLAEEAVSSHVDVYNDRGEAWIIQGDEGGNLTMISGRTGETRSTLNLGGAIQGSPAVYKDRLVVGTCSKNNAMMYGVDLH